MHDENDFVLERFWLQLSGLHSACKRTHALIMIGNYYNIIMYLSIETMFMIIAGTNREEDYEKQ